MGRGDQEGQQNYRLCSHISKEETSDVLRKMKPGKVIGLDCIPVEIWKCLGKRGIEWLTDLFNVIFMMAMMPVNGELVQSFSCSRKRMIFRIVIIIEVLNYLALL